MLRENLMRDLLTFFKEGLTYVYNYMREKRKVSSTCLSGKSRREKKLLLPRPMGEDAFAACTSKCVFWPSRAVNPCTDLTSLRLLQTTELQVCSYLHGKIG